MRDPAGAYWKFRSETTGGLRNPRGNSPCRAAVSKYHWVVPARLSSQDLSQNRIQVKANHDLVVLLLVIVTALRCHLSIKAGSLARIGQYLRIRSLQSDPSGDRRLPSVTGWLSLYQTGTNLLVRTLRSLITRVVSNHSH